MKNILSILLVCLALPGFSQWGKLYTGTTNDLNAIYFASENNGFICGSNGYIGKTINGGKKWVDISYSIPFKLFDVFFFDSLNGYVAGENSVLLKTMDGGQNWTNEVPLSADTDLKSIDFKDTGQGVVVGTRGKIFKYQNGKWTKESRIDKRDLIAVKMSPYGLTIAVGDSSLILINSNLDSTFNIASELSSSIPLNTVQFFEDHIYLGGGWYDDSLKDFRSQFFFSEDSGKTFFSNSTKDVETIRRMHHITKDKIYYLGLGSGVYTTDNLFATVHRLYAGTNNALNDLFFLNDSIVFTCGVAGTVTKSVHGAGWNTATMELNSTKIEAFPNPVSGKLYWHTNKPIKSVRIIDFSGKEIATYSSLFNNYIDLSNLKNGVYFVCFEEPNDSIHLKRIIID